MLFYKGEQFHLKVFANNFLNAKEKELKFSANYRKNRSTVILIDLDSYVEFKNIC